MTAPALVAEVLYDAPIELSLAAVVADVPGARVGAETLIVHERIEATLDDGTAVPLLTSVTMADRRTSLEREHDFSQTWDWPGAEGAVARATASVLLAEAMGHRHAPMDRVEGFLAVQRAVVAATAPLAVWWPNATRFTAPDRDYGVSGILNTRMFRGEHDEIVMDTLGLHAFGLPDVQCRIGDADPRKIAPALYDVATYVLEHGDVIADGDTLVGQDGGREWIARRSEALAPPDRAVLDLIRAG